MLSSKHIQHATLGLAMMLLMAGFVSAASEWRDDDHHDDHHHDDHYHDDDHYHHHHHHHACPARHRHYGPNYSCEKDRCDKKDAQKKDVETCGDECGDAFRIAHGYGFPYQEYVKPDGQVDGILIRLELALVESGCLGSSLEFVKTFFNEFWTVVQTPESGAGDSLKHCTKAWDVFADWERSTFRQLTAAFTMPGFLGEEFVLVCNATSNPTCSGDIANVQTVVAPTGFVNDPLCLTASPAFVGLPTFEFVPAPGTTGVLNYLASSNASGVYAFIRSSTGLSGGLVPVTDGGNVRSTTCSQGTAWGGCKANQWAIDMLNDALQCLPSETYSQICCSAGDAADAIEVDLGLPLSSIGWVGDRASFEESWFDFCFDFSRSTRSGEFLDDNGPRMLNGIDCPEDCAGLSYDLPDNSEDNDSCGGYTYDDDYWPCDDECYRDDHPYGHCDYTHDGATYGAGFTAPK